MWLKIDNYYKQKALDILAQNDIGVVFCETDADALNEIKETEIIKSMTASDWARALGSAGGAIGGASKSEAKRAAARSNGAKGGRPKKSSK